MAQQGVFKTGAVEYRGAAVPAADETVDLMAEIDATIPKWPLE